VSCTEDRDGVVLRWCYSSQTVRSRAVWEEFNYLERNRNGFELLVDRLKYRISLGDRPIGEERIVWGDKNIDKKGEMIKYKDFEYLWSEELKKTLQQYTLIMAEKARIQYELEPELYAVQNPTFAGGRSITETMSMTLANFIAANSGKFENASSLSNFLRGNTLDIVFNNSKAEFGAPDLFKQFLNEAAKEINKGQMGYIGWEETK